MTTRIAAFVSLVIVTWYLIPFAKPQAAAEGAPTATNNLPVIGIQEIETDAPESYAMLVAQNNKTMKDKFGLDNYIKVFVGESAGPDSGKVFAVSSAESFSKMAANWTAFDQELSLVKARVDMNRVRKLGANVTYKAVRFDGRNESSFVYNNRVMVTDEAGYLTALDGLRALLDAHDFKDAKINCYRVVSGRTDFSHLVSINCPSRERRAAMMDAISSEPWASEWIFNAAKYRTVVSNGTYRQLAH